MVSRSARMALSCIAVAAVCVVASPGCVVKLSERNEPLTNGGVTGPATDCSQVTPPGKGGPGTGEATTKFLGRFVTDPNQSTFDWSGNTISARFEGTQVSANFAFDHDADLIFEAVIDNRDPIKFTASSRQSSYLIAKNLPAGPHEITLVRNTEALFGTVAFTGFSFGDGGKILPPTERPRLMEIIGDSITCGYGIEGPNATCPYDVEVRPGVRVPLSENIYLAYGSAAARALSADLVTECYSGKGVVFNYREPADDPDAKTTVPQYWERTLASKPDGPAWDFSKEKQPQVVVVNLGTNDYTRDLNQDSVADGLDVPAFKKGYKAFLQVVRQRRPDAHIFVTVSPMLSDTFPFTGARSNMRDTFGEIVSELNAEGDKKIYRMEFVEMGTRYGLGCDYHPNVEVHRIMTDQLVGAIRSKTCW